MTHKPFENVAVKLQGLLSPKYRVILDFESKSYLPYLRSSLTASVFRSGLLNFFRKRFAYIERREPYEIIIENTHFLDDEKLVNLLNDNGFYFKISKKET